MEKTKVNASEFASYIHNSNEFTDKEKEALLEVAEVYADVNKSIIQAAVENKKGIITAKQYKQANKGSLIDFNEADSRIEFQNKFVPQGLVGFRIEYLNPDGSKIPNFFRVVTSSFFCEPVVTNQTNTTQKSIRYRYVEGNSNLIFLTLSPSSSPTNNPNATPFIGQPNQNIIISNTYFNPITLEIEMVEYDVSSLAIALYGNQTKSIDDGIYTIYDSQNNIYRQYNLYEIRDQFNALLYEVRQSRGNNIDFSKNFTNITS